MSAGPIILDIGDRVVADRDPPEVFTFDTDLTGHTAHLVIEDSTGTVVDTIAGVVSTVTATFTITAAAVATAGTYRYSVITDKDTATLRRTRIAGDWIVEDLAG
jgi:hypothetical protein